MGIVAGTGLTAGFRKANATAGVAPGSTPESTHPIFGAAVEFQTLENLFIEVDGLYRPLHVKGDPAGFTVLTWQFPTLLKYKFRGRRLRAFAELGPSFRTTGNDNGYDPSLYGITVGAGVEANLGKVKLAPTLRYIRWRADSKPPGLIPNQVEGIVGVSF